jgi:hypothetical protein
MRSQCLLPTVARWPVEQPVSITVANPTPTNRVARTAHRVRSMIGILPVHSPTRTTQSRFARGARARKISDSRHGRTTMSAA